MATKITTHVADAVNRLAQQYRDKPNITALISELAGRTQGLEDAAFPLLTDRLLDNATGVWLAFLGAIVGEPTAAAMPDETYRKRVKARIRANLSDGTTDDVLAVVRLLTAGELEMTWEPPAAFTLHVVGDELSAEDAELIAEFVRDAKAAGVRAILTFEASPGPYFEHGVTAYADGVHTIGADEVFVLAGTGALDRFPTYGGTLVIDEGTADEEEMDYTFFDASEPKFVLAGLLTANHDDHATVRLLETGDPANGYPEEMTYVDGNHAAGAGTLTVAPATTPFPSSGTLMIDEGTANEETKIYTAKAANSFTLSGTTANDHDDNATVRLVGSNGGEYLGAAEV